eukprot:COSAG06_NODE_20912_length_776_cov_3.113737_1_plen_61_part_00
MQPLQLPLDEVNDARAVQERVEWNGVRWWLQAAVRKLLVWVACDAPAVGTGFRDLTGKTV